MTRAEIEAYRQGVADLVGVATQTAEILRRNGNMAPLRLELALKILDALVEAAVILVAPHTDPDPLDPSRTEPS